MDPLFKASTIIARTNDELFATRSEGDGGERNDIPNVVPALCMVYLTPLVLSRRWTAATSLDTDADGVPMGMRQKST